MIYGWIENRFLADFLPFLILASAVGMVDVWRRLEVGRRWLRYGSLAIVTGLGVFSITANVGMASTPQPTWSGDQVLRCVQFQKTVSDLTGHPLAQNVVRGETLPTSAPADQLFVVGNCASLYISDGAGSPTNHTIFENVVDLGLLWYPVELGPDVRHTVDITFDGPIKDLGQSVPLVTIGTKSVSTISVEPLGTDEIRFTLKDPLDSSQGMAVRVKRLRAYRITIATDPKSPYRVGNLAPGLPPRRCPHEPWSSSGAHSSFQPRATSVADDRG